MAASVRTFRGLLEGRRATGRTPWPGDALVMPMRSWTAVALAELRLAGFDALAELMVGALDFKDIDRRARQELRIAAFIDLDLAHHLAER